MPIGLRFDWDPDKATQNLLKHRVSFDEASEVFGDSLARITYDTDHSLDEDRWHIIGRSQRNRTLFVVFCEREPQGSIMTYRIISARRATNDESREYEDGN